MAAALAGKDYFTLPQMMDIISQALKGHNVQWGHLDKTWDFTHIRGLMGVEFHRLRNAHSFAFTRTAAGITARWKQWLTDSTWSRPLTIVSAIQMRDFYRLRPPAEPRVFPEATASGILAFLDTLDVLLAARTSEDSTIPAGRSGRSWRHVDRQLDMAWLRRVVRQEELSLKDCRSIDDVLGDLIRIGKGMPLNHGNTISDQKQFPDDVLVHLFPGSDVPSLPVDSLVDVVGGAHPQEARQKATQLSATLCGPGDRLILRSPDKNHQLPFLMAVMVDTDGLNAGSAYVQWWLPGQSKKANHKGGKKKLVMDIFGPWFPADSLTLANLQALPPPLVKADDVLEWGFGLTEDKQIPFETLDVIMDKHGIDITGLTLSSTSRGNQYRMYRLMKH